MTCFIGLGSNIGDRRETLEKAAHALNELAGAIRLSPIYETPALVPDGAPTEWLQPYLNAVAEIQWGGTSAELFLQLKKIERTLNRTDAARWAPRTIDLDLLTFGRDQTRDAQLSVPHAGAHERSFVLDPLKDLSSGFVVPGRKQSVAVEARALPGHTPWIMGILNITPDSFSDGGELTTPRSLETRLQVVDSLGLQAIDVGAESTRPGATPVSVDEEWKRLEPALEMIQARYAQKLFRPFISLDTYRAQIAERALKFGINCINDVSGLADPRMGEVLRANPQINYVLMHSLGVPADSKKTLDEKSDPVAVLKKWFQTKLTELTQMGVNPDRLIFDPGIGFGKTPRQSLVILKRLVEFSDLPVRILVGHSRKSFTHLVGAHGLREKDAATLALSLEFARKGVDILRVHDFESHAVAFRARAEVLL